MTPPSYNKPTSGGTFPFTVASQQPLGVACNAMEINWHEYFTCDPAIGLLYWKERPRSHFTTDNVWAVCKGRDANKPAGHDEACGYVSVRVNYKPYRAHRVIWEMFKGPIPPGMQIDHINMVRNDNRLENLRLATNAQNNSNRGLQSNNTSGHKGVTWDKFRQKWVAQIRIGPKTKRLGRFTEIEDAIEARRKATEEIHGDFARHEGQGLSKSSYQKQPSPSASKTRHNTNVN